MQTRNIPHNLTMSKWELSKLIALENANMIELVKIVNAVIGDGSPKAVFSTVFELEEAFPDGELGIYLVTQNGHWYYYNGVSWQDGGIYQATGMNKINAKDVVYNGIVPFAMNAQEGIDKTYERISRIVAQSGTSSTEVVDARGGFTVLVDRLDDVDNKLSVTAKLKDIYKLNSDGFPKFEKYANNPIVTGSSETQNQAGYASVIDTKGVIDNPIDRFYMYWSGHDGGGIWLSTSPHPLGPWTIYGQVVTDVSMYPSVEVYNNTPGAHIASPEVIFIPELNTIRMYFHIALGGQFTQFCHSTNGINWTKQNGDVTIASFDGSWNEAETSYLRVIRKDGVYYGTYQGRDRVPNVKGLGFGISSDGIRFSWSKIPMFYNTIFRNQYNPQGDIGGTPAFVSIKDTIWLVYADGNANRTIKCVAVNNPFERQPRVNVVLEANGLWEGNKVESPTFLYHDEHLYMYYNGQQNNLNRSIGVASYKLEG